MRQRVIKQPVFNFIVQKVSRERRRTRVLVGTEEVGIVLPPLLYHFCGRLPTDNALALGGRVASQAVKDVFFVPHIRRAYKNMLGKRRRVTGSRGTASFGAPRGSPMRSSRRSPKVFGPRPRSRLRTGKRYARGGPGLIRPRTGRSSRVGGSIGSARTDLLLGIRLPPRIFHKFVINESGNFALNLTSAGAVSNQEINDMSALDETDLMGLSRVRDVYGSVLVNAIKVVYRLTASPAATVAGFDTGYCGGAYVSMAGEPLGATQANANDYHKVRAAGKTAIKDVAGSSYIYGDMAKATIMKRVFKCARLAPDWTSARDNYTAAYGTTPGAIGAPTVGLNYRVVLWNKPYINDNNANMTDVQLAQRITYTRTTTYYVESFDVKSLAN